MNSWAKLLILCTRIFFWETNSCSDGRENSDAYWIQRAIMVPEGSILFWASWILPTSSNTTSLWSVLTLSSPLNSSVGLRGFPAYTCVTSIRQSNSSCVITLTLLGELYKLWNSHYVTFCVSCHFLSYVQTLPQYFALKQSQSTSNTVF
jgi:hypothetical protein